MPAIIRHPYLTPAGDGTAAGGGTLGAATAAAGAGGTTTAPETKEVDLFGMKVALPKAEADKLIAERDKRTAEYRSAIERLGAADAAKAEAERRAADEARRAEDMKLAKAGEVDELRRRMTSEHDARIASLSGELVRLNLDAAVATNGRVVPEARGDAISLLMASATFKVDGGKLAVVGADGKPLVDATGQAIGVDTYVATWLDKRPHLLRDKTPTGSGGNVGGGSAGVAGQVIHQSAFDAMQPRDRAKFLNAGGRIQA